MTSCMQSSWIRWLPAAVAQVGVFVKSDGGTVFQKTLGFNDRAQIRKRLKDVKEGMLALAIKADGKDVLSFSMRFMAKEPIAVAWLPDPAHRKLGLIDADFIGYWEDNCPVKTATPKALASLYNTPGSSFVVAVTNRLPDPTDVLVIVDLKALDLEGKAITAVDERTGKLLHLKGGTFTVPIKYRNYTLVSLGQR